MIVSLRQWPCPSPCPSPFFIPVGGDRPSGGQPQTTEGPAYPHLLEGEVRPWAGPEAGLVERQWTTLLWSRMGPHGPMACWESRKRAGSQNTFSCTASSGKSPMGSLTFIFSVQRNLEQWGSFTYSVKTRLFYGLRVYLAQDRGSH